MGALAGLEIRAASPRPSAGRLAISNDLRRQLQVRNGSWGAHVIEKYGFPMAWSLGQPNIPGDHGLEDLASEVPLDLSSDLGCHAGSAIEHGQQHPLDLQVRVQFLLDEVD